VREWPLRAALALAIGRPTEVAIGDLREHGSTSFAGGRQTPSFRCRRCARRPPTQWLRSIDGAGSYSLFSCQSATRSVRRCALRVGHAIRVEEETSRSPASKKKKKKFDSTASASSGGAHFDEIRSRKRGEAVRAARSSEVDCLMTSTGARLWSSLDWAERGGWPIESRSVKNFSRIFNILRRVTAELLQQTPKTRIEAGQILEAKRAADPRRAASRRPWRERCTDDDRRADIGKDRVIPAGSVCTVITPIELPFMAFTELRTVGCYLSGSPMIFKGHPFHPVRSRTPPW